MTALRPLLLLLVLFAAWCDVLHAQTMHGLPLMKRFAADELPGAPDYVDIAIDVRGVLYVASGDGVMRFRGGGWDMLPLHDPYALWMASDDVLYVGASNAFGILHTGDDGAMRFEDLSAKFALADGETLGTIWAIRERPEGIWFRADAGLFLLGKDGSAQHWPLPAQARSGIFDIDGAIHMRMHGTGLMRFEDGRFELATGGQGLAYSGLGLEFPYRDGSLLVTNSGFWFFGPDGLVKLPSDADREFPRHRPYSGVQLPDGSFAIGSSDGVLMWFSVDLVLLDRIELGSRSLLALGADREGGLWVSSDVELKRLRLPSPWTIYDGRHGLGERILDSAWYDGHLWVGGAHDLSRCDRVELQPEFSKRGWFSLEVHALEATEAGLVIGERHGLHVLDRGAEKPRMLNPELRETAVTRLKRSRFSPQHMLATGSYKASWLSIVDGRWQARGHWDVESGGSDVGLHETAPGEFWANARNDSVQRWRVDMETGTLRERRRFGPQDGLGDADIRLLLLDDRLYAISASGTKVLEGERFVEARLPSLPGLERPMELAAVDTAFGTYAWTARQLWRRAPGETRFLPIELGGSAVQGYTNLKLHADGKLRLPIWSGLLEFDPEVHAPEAPPLRASVDMIALNRPDGSLVPMPLPPKFPAVLPPESGVRMRLGLLTMEPDIEFRFRMLGFSDDWTAWSRDRDLNYNKLPPGDYRFELEARTRGGREAEPLVFEFRVDPLWSETLWAKLLFAVLGLLAVLGIAQGLIWLRLRRMVARNLALEIKVEERTIELSERTAELEAANRKLAELATEDALTGIPNRRAMERALDREWRRCAERGEPLALVMSDVDHFKQFNDEHGHQAGDVQLRCVARAFKDEAKAAGELPARYGGEEFVLILPGSSLDAALGRAENLRLRVAEVTAEGGCASTASFGVASVLPTPGLNWHDLFERADAALYRAKHNGRNRVEAAKAESAK